MVLLLIQVDARLHVTDLVPLDVGQQHGDDRHDVRCRTSRLGTVRPTSSSDKEQANRLSNKPWYCIKVRTILYIPYPRNTHARTHP